MEPCSFRVPFGDLSEEEVSSIISEKPQFSFELIYSSDSMLKEKTQENKVVLQIRGHYLVQMDSSYTNIISGFRFDYQIKFEFSRSSYSHQLKNSQIGGNKPMARISFIFTEGEKKVLTFFSFNQEKFDKLIRILQKKNIVQLGFSTQKFKAIHKLGNGGIAKVFSAIRLQDKKKVAIKCFRRQNYFKSDNGKGKEAFKKQIKIHSELKSKYICKFLGVYESSNSIYVILEPLSCSLGNFLSKYGAQDQVKVRKLFYQLLKGVEYLHSKGIMHRDLKPQNIMMKHSSNSYQHLQISIIDFGLAQYTNSPQFIYKRCGTPGYVAPEIFTLQQTENKRYNQKCDVFSLGVILYNLLFNRPVFTGNVREIMQKNLKCEVNVAYLAQGCSQLVMNLLDKMLEKNPEKRITIKEALQHDFFQGISKEDLDAQETTQGISQLFN